MGTGRGVGTTHMAILAANVLANGMGLKTALAEYNGRNQYIKIRREVKASVHHVPETGEGIREFFYGGIHFYGNMLQRQPDKLYTSGCEAVVLDMEYGDKNVMEEFLRSDIRIVMLGHNPWKIGDFRTFQKNERLPQTAYICADFGIDGREAEKLGRQYGVCIHTVPTESNPFCISPHGFNEIMHILKQ
jgi:hypothetical protein